MATNWREIGDTTYEAWEAEIRARAPSSPLLKEGRAMYEAARPHTRLALGMLWIEDRFNTDPSDNFPLSFHNAFNMKTPDGAGWMEFPSYAAAAKGWRERITSDTYKPQDPGVYKRTTTVEELVHAYAPSSDNNDEAAYVRTINLIVAELKVLERELGGGTDMATKPYVLLVAGHRSYNDAGNPAEQNLTDDLARIYTAAFRGAGYKADWWQRDLDKDADPDDTVGGLDTVALGCARHLDVVSGPKALLDLHFNGAHSPVHAIVPNSRGLTTAYANGSPADDTYANNVLDRAFAAKWAEAVSRAFGLGLFHGGANEAGVMLEGETGVGLQGFRLATFAASAGNRNDTIRTVLEHAGTDDWGGDRESRFQLCATIAVNAMNAVYNVTGTPPTPEPPKPSKFALPVTNWMKGRDTPVAVEIGDDTKTVQVFAVERQYEAIARTWRYQWPDGKGAKVGDKLEVREKFTGAYTAKVGSSWWVVTPAGSWIRMSALTPRLTVTPA